MCAGRVLAFHVLYQNEMELLVWKGGYQHVYLMIELFAWYSHPYCSILKILFFIKLL